MPHHKLTENNDDPAIWLLTFRSQDVFGHGLKDASAT